MAEPVDMTDLAASLAVELHARGIDAVYVMIMRKSDNSMGGAMAGKGIPFDSLVACIVQDLGTLRHELGQNGGHVASESQTTETTEQET